MAAREPDRAHRPRAWSKRPDIFSTASDAAEQPFPHRERGLLILPRTFRTWPFGPLSATSRLPPRSLLYPATCARIMFLAGAAGRPFANEYPGSPGPPLLLAAPQSPPLFTWVRANCPAGLVPAVRVDAQAVYEDSVM